MNPAHITSACSRTKCALLADCQTGTGNKKEAGETLEHGVQYLTKHKACVRLLDDLEAHLKELRKAKSKTIRKAKQKA